ncbi:unnamed protein product [Acanthoscelides obtectus]|uniref:Protein sleepless n=1 Tax=Acanthoscelides obtectus TaxID=200917 RepID=A0A9P0P7T4_ACAOB|nr:unnamed protein product [Acanthoscelides obtectus]CAK1627694.1 hypothetical protein AOBTE_LOCUS4771 [Acanthoscelides obtectus]
MSQTERILIFTIVCCVYFKTSHALNCYQCSGSDPEKPFQCNEWLSNDIDIKPEPCDAVYNAKYCIKHIGRFEASAIFCYQCSALESLDCADGMIHMAGIQPQNCDHVFEARYCIKMMSLDGGIGAKRFCSSLDLGNYCNFVKQPGDELTYRTCVYTCTGDGCNAGYSIKSSLSLIIVSLSIWKTFMCLS